MSRTESYAKTFLKFMQKNANRNCYNGTALGKQLYAAACVLNPQASFRNEETTLSLAKAAVLADSIHDKSFDITKVPKSSPSERILREYIKDLATDVTFLALSELKEDRRLNQ